MNLEDCMPTQFYLSLSNSLDVSKVTAHKYQDRGIEQYSLLYEQAKKIELLNDPLTYWICKCSARKYPEIWISDLFCFEPPEDPEIDRKITNLYKALGAKKLI